MLGRVPYQCSEDKLWKKWKTLEWFWLIEKISVLLANSFTKHGSVYTLLGAVYVDEKIFSKNIYFNNFFLFLLLLIICHAPIEKPYESLNNFVLFQWFPNIRILQNKFLCFGKKRKDLFRFVTTTPAKI